LDAVEISERERLRERNSRAACADGHRLSPIHQKALEYGERTRAAGTKTNLSMIWQEIPAIAPQRRKCARSLATNWDGLSRRQKTTAGKRRSALTSSSTSAHIATVSHKGAVKASTLTPNMGAPKPISKRCSILKIREEFLIRDGILDGSDDLGRT
jgi:hypothetical protein